MFESGLFDAAKGLLGKRKAETKKAKPLVEEQETEPDEDLDMEAFTGYLQEKIDKNKDIRVKGRR